MKFTEKHAENSNFGILSGKKKINLENLTCFNVSSLTKQPLQKKKKVYYYATSDDTCTTT